MNFKKLVSPSEQERNSEFELLSDYFKNTTDISDEEYLKIFKSIYYNYWLCETKSAKKKSLQISKFLKVSNEKSKFVKFFLQTLDREWESIDFLRLDKFYLLLRNLFKQIAQFNNFKNLSEILLQILESEKSKRGLKLFLVQILTEEILVTKYSKSLLKIYSRLLKSEDVYKILKSKKISVHHKKEILREFKVGKKFEKIIDLFTVQKKLLQLKNQKKLKRVQWSKELERVKVFSKKDCISPRK